ncbi:uncharacterized protein LOC129755517 isoform X2 [Uranotaenia lowii]|uniref:uncharacterized protein LOC129755517 isoform X2 n=1 Tax=Uranotaenia lowii TaxID=190385 RepID=UPI00247B1EA2|nr:uncharacterized protein LOC129755517 isoform X2 [Uranotaenia lowii]
MKFRIWKHKECCASGNRQFQFSADHVRVLLFRECDIRGRKLLFDSSAVEKVNESPSSGASSSSTSSAFHHHGSSGSGSSSSGRSSTTSSQKSMPQVQKCDHCKVLFQHSTNPRGDIKSLAEMIFGSTPMAFQGSSLKVHWLKVPKAIMCSHVFPTPVRNTVGGGSSSSKKTSISTFLGSDLVTAGHGSGAYIDRHPSGSDLSSIDTTSLRSFTVTSSTSTQHDTSYNHRQRPPIPLEFGHLERLTDPRLSTNSGMDSGYGGTDPWAFSPQSSRHPMSSHRSSLASISSDFDCFRRLSTDTSVDLPQASNCASLDNCSQYGSFHRRVSKNLSTSFENHLTLADHVGHVDEVSHSRTNATSASSQVTASDSCVGSKNRRNSETMDLTRRKAFSGELLSTATNYHGRPPNKKARLGIALYMQMNDNLLAEMEAFCSEHMSIFESMLCRLRVAAENACYRWPQFLQIMLAAWHAVQTWLVDFFGTPRLENPVWITLSSGSAAGSVAGTSSSNKVALTIANNFMNDLCSLLSVVDTKDTNLFISTLLTAVLTHHLGWVSTIAPINGPLEPTSQNGAVMQREKERICKIKANHPYNVLWAQLGDLYGAIGHPVKLSKTIICGSPQLSGTMGKILNVLSYFIRCSEVRRTVHVESFEESRVKEAFVAQNVVSGSNVSRVRSEAGEGTSGFKSPEMRRSNSGMIRSATRMKDLTGMGKDEGAPEGELSKALKKNVMNDIPNVLAYTDSRFVQQELRIGNKSMDTELMMTQPQKQFLEMIYHIKKGSETSPIRMTLTPSDETGQEAIELDLNDTDDTQSVRLSKLITENSIGEGESGRRLYWGLERIKEGMSMEQLKYIDGLRGDYEVLMKSKPKEEVMFVLGENEQLVNLKPSSAAENPKPTELGAVGGQKPCTHSKLRKHSVIFNFDRYPKVVENYLRSKNLDLSEYDFLEKGMKLEMALKFSIDTENQQLPDFGEECEVCRNTSLLYLQTPTNASELEFSSDLNELSSVSSFPDSIPRSNQDDEHPGHSEYIPKTYAMTTLEENTELKIKHPDSILKLVEMPLSKTTVLSNDENNNNNNNKTDCGKSRKLLSKVGFMPSLFSQVADHYIPDMILQATTAPPIKWEKPLKKDLSCSSRFALMEQYPVENLAVIANLDTHEVRILTSHTSSLGPPLGQDADVVGMSQLVSSMLETVHAMWSSGLSAFQCMAFIESKLREFYLQSETIASFLLATDFCTIGSITSALDITANDMPLLLSVASIHAPEVTKRYGIQFR